MKSALALLLAAVLAVAAQAQPREPIGKDGTPGTPSSPQDSGKPRLRIGPSISIVISPALLFPRRGSASDDDAYEAGQLLVLWPDTTTAAAGTAELAALGLTPAQTVELGELGATLALLVFPDSGQARVWRDRLRAAQPQWVVDLNARVSTMEGDTPSAPAPAAARLYAQRMLGLEGGPRGDTPIGVIDTAIDAALLAPRSAAWAGAPPRVHSVLGRDDAPAPAHGSAIALLLAAAPQPNGFAGVGTQAPLAWAVALRQTGDKAGSNSWLLAQAFDWLLAQRVQLVNASLGGAGDEILRWVVQRVLARGVAVLAAAGNRPDEAPVYPAAYPGVWGVTAVDARGRPWSNASRGAHVAFAAPGVDLWVPEPSGLAVRSSAGTAPVAGRYVSGSSFATALATGVVARAPANLWPLDGSQRLQRLCSHTAAGSASTLLGCGVLRGAPPAATAGADPSR